MTSQLQDKWSLIEVGLILGGKKIDCELRLDEADQSISLDWNNLKKTIKLDCLLGVEMSEADSTLTIHTYYSSWADDLISDAEEEAGGSSFCFRRKPKRVPREILLNINNTQNLRKWYRRLLWAIERKPYNE